MTQKISRLIGVIDPDADLDQWPDGPEDKTRDELLAAAWEKCARYVYGRPDAPAPENPPAGMKQAQLLQTVHLWARKQAGNAQGYGGDGYMIQTYPLVMEAKDLLRMYRPPLRGLR